MKSQELMKKEGRLPAHFQSSILQVGFTVYGWFTPCVKLEDHLSLLRQQEASLLFLKMACVNQIETRANFL